MQTSIAQSFALVLFGNQHLSGAPLAGFWPEASVFKFCATVRFVTLSGPASKGVETIAAADPLVWFDRLAAAGIAGLRLRFTGRGKSAKEDRKLAGFAGGGGRWLIEAIRDTRTCDYWESRWEVGDRNAPDRRIWNVTYGRTGEACARNPDTDSPLATAKSDLDKILTDIARFAECHRLDQFAPSFRRAQRLLSDGQPLSGAYHAEFVDAPLLPLPAAQLLGAA